MSMAYEVTLNWSGLENHKKIASFNFAISEQFLHKSKKALLASFKRLSLGLLLKLAIGMGLIF